MLFFQLTGGGDQIHQNLDNLMHLLNAADLIAAMTVGAAGSQIRARQSHKRQPGAIRSAANRFPKRLQPRIPDSLRPARSLRN